MSGIQASSAGSDRRKVDLFPALALEGVVQLERIVAVSARGPDSSDCSVSDGVEVAGSEVPK